MQYLLHCKQSHYLFTHCHEMLVYYAEKKRKKTPDNIESLMTIVDKKYIFLSSKCRDLSRNDLVEVPSCVVNKSASIMVL